MKIETLQQWSRSPWDAAISVIRSRASIEEEKESTLRTQADRTRNAWPSHGAQIAEQLEAQADVHGEMKTQIESAALIVDDAIVWTLDAQVKLNDGLNRVSNMAHVDHDEYGNCWSTFKDNFWNPFDDVTAWIAAINAREGTHLLRQALYAAEQLDKQQALALARLAGFDAPTPSDGPLDLSDAGLRYQAELNNQGRYGDCVTMSALLSLVNSDPEYIRKHMKWDPDKEEYVITLYDNGNPVQVRVGMDEVMWDGAGLPGDRNPSFMSVYEAAIQKQFGDIDEGKTPGFGIERLTPGDAKMSIDPSFNEIRTALDKQPPGLVVVGSAGRLPIDMSDVDPSKRIADSHAYSVKGFDEQGNIIVVNPWGPGGGWSGGIYYPGEVHLTEAEYRRYFGKGSIAETY